MVGKPKLENRPAQLYLAIRSLVPVKELGAALPKLHNDLADWMEARQIPPSGPPFFRYLVIDPEKGFEMEVGVPVAQEVEGEGAIRFNVLPAGCYATLLHTGHFSGLRDATRELLAWADKNDIAWQMASYGTAEAWEARLEVYLNVGLEKDPAKWQTELVFLTASD